MGVSRTQKVLVNTASELILEFVTAICSFILPRLILSHFGSDYNGIVSSISQFIGCIALLKSGIGSVTRAALYKPLSENNTVEISRIVNATQRFMQKIAIFFLIAIFVLAFAYPFLVADEFEWIFTFSLVFILSISTFGQYFFGLTYQMVLQADQKTYIISLITSISTIMNTIVASMLILCGYSIHIVKLGSAIVFCLPPLFYNVYVKKKYLIDRKVSPSFELINQRWDAFGHQLANFINTNTDIMIITLFLDVKEVSVYTVYMMIGNAIKKVVSALSSGTMAAFGNIIAKNERVVLKTRFRQFEILIFFVATILLDSSLILILPFMGIYTRGIDDAVYIRDNFAFLICISVFLACVKVPYEQIVFASGEFKRTKNNAYAEALINIFSSIILVLCIGLDGVIIGTIVSALYRIISYYSFARVVVLNQKEKTICSMMVYTFLCTCITYGLSILISVYNVNNYFRWILYSIFVTSIVFIVCFLMAIIFWRKSFLSMFIHIWNIFVRKSGKVLK